MAEQTNRAPSFGRQSRLAIAHEATDRLDIARHLIKAEPVSCRLALVLQLLERAVDDVAELAGEPEADARELQAIRRAGQPLPKRKRTIWQKLEAVAFVGIVGLAVAGAAVWIGVGLAIRWGWL